MSSYLFTSEFVSEGHPDKLADRISDAVLDYFLQRDPCAIATDSPCGTGHRRNASRHGYAAYWPRWLRP